MKNRKEFPPPLKFSWCVKNSVIHKNRDYLKTTRAVGLKNQSAMPSTKLYLGIALDFSYLK